MQEGRPDVVLAAASNPAGSGGSQSATTVALGTELRKIMRAIAGTDELDSALVVGGFHCPLQLLHCLQESALRRLNWGPGEENARRLEALQDKARATRDEHGWLAHIR